MSKYTKRAMSKVIFKRVFASLLCVISVFFIFACSFILKDTVELLKQDDFVIGQVFNKEDAEESLVVNGLREGKGELIQQKQEIAQADITYLEFTNDTGYATEVTHEVRFVHQSGRIYSIQNFRHEGTLILPDLPLVQEDKGITYTLTWLEELNYVVTEDVTYHFVYKAL